MTFQERFNFIKKRLFEKSNIIFFIVLVLLMVILYGCAMVINLSFDYRETSKKEDVGYRTISTNMSIDDLNNIDNIIFHESTRFRDPMHRSVSEFDNKLLGSVTLYPILGQEDLKIVDGRNIEGDGEAICPDKFYPHDGGDGIYNSLYLGSKDSIGREFVIESSNEDRLGEKTTFKIVGTYKNKKLMNSNACYITINDFANNKSKYEFIVEYGGDEGKTTECHEYESYIVVVDKYENVNKVVKQITDKGYFADVGNFNDVIFEYLVYIPLFIALIVIIIAFNIIYSFIVKKNKYRDYELGILRSIGYQNKEISKIEALENGMLAGLSFIVAFILYVIAYIIVTKIFLDDFVYMNYYIPIPYLYIIIISLLVYILVYYTTIYQLKKTSKKKIVELLNSEVR